MTMLAIGIASNATVFSLVNGVYFRRPDLPDAGRLVSVSATSQTRLCAACGVGASYPGYLDWRNRATAFASLEAYLETSAVASAPLVPDEVRAARVTGGFFGTIGVPAAVGRLIGPADVEAGAPAVAVLSHRLWQRDFGGDPAVVRRSLRVDGRPVEIIGVVPAGRGVPESAEIWLPLESATPSTDREDRRYGVVGRLRAGVPLADAEREMIGLAATIAREHPLPEAEWSASVVRLGDERDDTEGAAFVVMLGAVGLMLAIACANLAALVLARSTRRRLELTVRAALGASRSRLIRQLMAEAVVLGAVGGTAGLLLASWGVPLAARLLASSEMPAYLEFVLDWRVVAFCGIATLVSVLAVGLVPAITATRVNLVTGLKTAAPGARAGSGGDAWWRQALIAGQLALVLVLLAAAALVGRTFLHFVGRPAGYDRAGLLYGQVPLLGATYDSVSGLRTAAGAIERAMAATLPGVTALSSTRFLRGFGPEARPMRVDGVDVAPGAGPRFALAVTPRYFEAMGLPLLAGRTFGGEDRFGTMPVAVVNRAMADVLWPNRSAMSGRILLEPHVPDDPWRTVVGVVGDVEGPLRPGAPVNPLVYLPYDQTPGRPLDITARTPLAETAFAATARAALAGVDSDQPLNNVRSAEDEHRRTYWYVGVFASFYAAFGAFALVLAVVGIYGVVSQTVSDRMREFGIRAALGADRRRLSALVLGGGLRLAVAGAAAGLVGAFLTTRFLGFLLFGADPASPDVLGGVALLLVATTALATLVPAWRAASVDPAVTLRSD